MSTPPDRAKHVGLKLFLALLCFLAGWTILENAVFPALNGDRQSREASRAALTQAPTAAQPARATAALPAEHPTAPPISTSVGGAYPGPTAALPTAPPTPTALPTAPAATGELAPPQPAATEPAPLPVTMVAGPPAPDYRPTFRNDGQVNRVSPAFWPCKSGQIKADNAASLYYTPQSALYDAVFNNVTCYETSAEAEQGGFKPAK